MLVEYSNLSGIVDARDHFKNGARSKSLMSRRNFLIKSLFSLLCLFSAVNLYAKEPVSVKSGDISVFKEKATALFEIDYSAATADGLPVDEYMKNKKEDWRKNQKVNEKGANFFNQNIKKIKGLRVTKNPNAPYKIVIHVISLDMGNAAGAFTGVAFQKSGGVVISGTVDVINMKTNEVVCTLNVDEVRGVKNVSENNRLFLAYSEIGKEIRKLVMKSK